MVIMSKPVIIKVAKLLTKTNDNAKIITLAPLVAGSSRQLTLRNIIPSQHITYLNV
jgi:hypothetical protein